MKLYKRSDFLKLPEGVIYSKGGKWYFNGFYVKGETTKYNDWYERQFDWVDGMNDQECEQRLEEMESTGCSYPMQRSESREGFFEDDTQLFLVYEKEDLFVIKDCVEEAINVCDELWKSRDK